MDSAYESLKVIAHKLPGFVRAAATHQLEDQHNRLNTPKSRAEAPVSQKTRKRTVQRQKNTSEWQQHEMGVKLSCTSPLQSKIRETNSQKRTADSDRPMEIRSPISGKRVICASSCETASEDSCLFSIPEYYRHLIETKVVQLYLADAFFHHRGALEADFEESGSISQIEDADAIYASLMIEQKDEAFGVPDAAARGAKVYHNFDSCLSCHPPLMEDVPLCNAGTVIPLIKLYFESHLNFRIMGLEKEYYYSRVLPAFTAAISFLNSFPYAEASFSSHSGPRSSAILQYYPLDQDSLDGFLRNEYSKIFPFVASRLSCHVDQTEESAVANADASDFATISPLSSRIPSARITSRQPEPRNDNDSSVVQAMFPHRAETKNQKSTTDKNDAGKQQGLLLLPHKLGYTPLVHMLNKKRNVTQKVNKVNEKELRQLYFMKKLGCSNPLRMIKLLTMGPVDTRVKCGDNPLPSTEVDKDLFRYLLSSKSEGRLPCGRGDIGSTFYKNFHQNRSIFDVPSSLKCTDTETFENRHPDEAVKQKNGRNERLHRLSRLHEFFRMKRLELL